MPFPVLSAQFDEVIPTQEPALPEHLTGVWLVGPVGTTVLRWRRGHGWSRYDDRDDRSATSR